MLIANFLGMGVILLSLKIAFNYLELNLYSGSIFILFCSALYIWVWHKIYEKYIPLIVYTLKNN